MEDSRRMTDTELLDWLEQQYGCGLINDDDGHWALVWDGMQDVVTGPADLQTTFFIEKDKWHDTVREAIQAAYEEMKSAPEEDEDDDSEQV